MKSRVSLFICLVIFSCGQSRNTGTEIIPDSNAAASARGTGPVVQHPASIEAIKQLYFHLNDQWRDAQLDSSSIKYDCSGERAGRVTYFSDRGKLRIIRHTYNEYSHFSATDQYFISEDQLFFAHLTGTSWSFEAGQAATGVTRDHITEKRLYLNRGKPLLCLEKSYEIISGSSDNPLPENVSNRKTDCKDAQGILKNFNKLLAFRDSSNKDCLGK